MDERQHFPRHAANFSPLVAAALSEFTALVPSSPRTGPAAEEATVAPSARTERAASPEVTAAPTGPATPPPAAAASLSDENDAELLTPAASVLELWMTARQHMLMVREEERGGCLRRCTGSRAV